MGEKDLPNTEADELLSSSPDHAVFYRERVFCWSLTGVLSLVLPSLLSEQEKGGAGEMLLLWLSLSAFPHGMGWAPFKQESIKAVWYKTQGSLPIPVGFSCLPVSTSLACFVADADEGQEMPISCYIPLPALST